MADHPTGRTTALASSSVPARIAVFVGGGLLVFGSFLPWVKATVSVLTFERNGLDRDGVYTLVLGVAAVLVFSLVRGTTGRVLTLLAALMAAAVACYDVVDVQRMADEISTGGGSLSVEASVGIGLWICAIGALIVIIGVMVAFGEAMANARS